MKFSMQWLREWVNPALDDHKLAEQYTMTGLEVDSIEPVAAQFSGVVIGNIMAVQAHPNADKLRVCQVQVDADAPLSIVCGASNAQVGMKVPTALIGAILPGLTIKKSKLRGVESYGMLCSAAELGMAESAEGLLELPDDAPIGMDVRAYLGLEDFRIDIDFTPNRGDCLSILGMSRETGALTQSALSMPEIARVEAQSQAIFPVSIASPQACPYYVGRVIQGIQQASTPIWMRERLRRSGLRPIHPVVDVTNYVLLELGQPMHAFDLAHVSQGITVRDAQALETLTLLDGQTITLRAGDLVIADAAKPLALAGVMGGADSAVSAQTVDIFLESAYFSPAKFAGCARRYGLQTDSSYRFERGVDPQGQARAMERATALLLAICGGVAGPLVEVSFQEFMPQPQPITLRAARIAQLLGCEVAPETVSDILHRLGMTFREEQGVWQVLAPAFRHDIGLEIDLIEEIARIVGYNQLPVAASVKLAARIHAAPGVTLRHIRQVLVERGYQEAITYSFVDPIQQAKLSPEIEPVPLANPISADMGVMRNTLWTGLLQAAQYNWQRQQKDIRLFESGLCFHGPLAELVQQNRLAGLIIGAFSPEQWGEARREANFFDIKNDVERILSLSGLLSAVQIMPYTHPALHPGQAARIIHHDVEIGWLGVLHPALAVQWELPSTVLLFELLLDPLLVKNRPQFTPISKFPSIRRDLALVVENRVKAADLLACAQKAGSALLTCAHVFDIYEGKGIPTGKRSIAIGLTFRSATRNLTEQEIDGHIEQILASLTQTFQATLRE